MRTFRYLVGLAMAVALVLGATAGRAQKPVRYEHRVVVPTTARLYASEINENLERNVNALAARGYELTAIVGGDVATLDAILTRRPYSRTGTNDTSVVLAVMARPVDGPRIARDYRVLHIREPESAAKELVPLGAAGYRLKFTELDGPIAHVVFERIAGAPPVEFREFQNRNRRTWMEQLLADADVRARMTQVAPVALGAGIMELGPPQSSPGDVSWLNAQTHRFEDLEGRIDEMVKTGYGVGMVRRRGPNDLDVLMMKPAGRTTSSADYDLDDGPWGMACARGRMAGAAVGPDGDVYCAVDQFGTSPASNRGLDLTVRPLAPQGGAVLFRGPTCAIDQRVRSSRPAAKRVAFALQFEQEIARALEPGYRAVRALAAVDSRGQARIVVFTSNGAVTVPAGAAPAETSPAPAAYAELDVSRNDRAQQLEAAVNTALANGGPDVRDMWAEVSTGLGGSSSALLFGCTSIRVGTRAAEAAAKAVLVREGLGDVRLSNRIVIEP